MTLTALALLAATNTAGAAADIETTITIPNSSLVYEDDSYSVQVKNVGNRNANNVVVTVQLPETNTSPQVFTMGEVSNLDSRCTQSGTEITCNLGRVKKNKSETRTFDMYLPVSVNSLDFSASATTSSSESNTANNDDSDSATVIYEDIVLAGPLTADNSHCTGTDLQGYYECTLFPSSISTHQVTLNADGTLTFAYPGYAGSWGQDTDDQLWMEYTQNGQTVAEFEGYGVDASAQCFEGITTFPGSAYNSAYEVCLQ